MITSHTTRRGVSPSRHFIPMARKKLIPWTEEEKDLFDSMQRDGSVFIPGNVPSLKNGKYKGAPNPLAARYIQKNMEMFIRYRDRFFSLLTAAGYKPDDYPIVLMYQFVRDKGNRFDYDNAISMLQDCMTGSVWTQRKRNKSLGVVETKPRYHTLCGCQPHDAIWIIDDDSVHLVSIPDPRGSFLDRKCPGVYITPIPRDKWTNLI